MREEFWLGKGHTSQNPYIEIVTRDVEVIDFHGRTVIIPSGSECKHFETLNKGWLIWRSPDGKGHIVDVG